MAVRFPFFTMQEFNLDWLMVQFKKMLQFMPIDSGHIGDVLQRNAQGAAWEPPASVVLDIHSLTQEPAPDPADELPIYDVSAQANRKITISDIQTSAPVTSVNGQTGAVVLSIPTDTSDLVNDSGFVDAAGAAAAAPVQSVNGQTGAVTISTGGAVTSVNGQTGDVILSIPTDTSDLVNDSGFVDAAGAAAAAPVQSVNGLTGAVSLTINDVDVLGGSAGSVTNLGQSGYGTITDLEKLLYKISSDNKWLCLNGYFTFTINTLSDFSWVELGGFSMNVGGHAFSYKCPALVVNSSSGALDVDASKQISITRVSDRVRLIIYHPAATGEYKIIFNSVLLQIDT